MRVVSAGSAVFAATLVAIGILGLLKGDLVAIWQLGPKGVSAREGLAYLCAAISVAAGVACRKVWKLIPSKRVSPFSVPIHR